MAYSKTSYLKFLIWGKYGRKNSGAIGYYELLDFDPSGMTYAEAKEKAKEILYDKYYFGEEEMDKILETVYLMEWDKLIRLRDK